MQHLISFTFCLIFVALFHHGQPQGQFHQSDPLGNFKVSYAATGGHFLVEDRTYDGTAHLGNYGYNARDGESVGVAYGTDGAGFVIRGPGAGASARSYTPAAAPPPPPPPPPSATYHHPASPASRRVAAASASTVHQTVPSYNNVVYDDGAYLARYQQSSPYTSGSADYSQNSVTSYSSSSSLPANPVSTYDSGYSSSFSSSNVAPSITATTTTTSRPPYYFSYVPTPPPAAAALPTYTSNYIEPYSYSRPALRKPFSYAFESYSYQPPVPTATVSPLLSSSYPVPQQPLSYSYNQFASSPSNILQYQFNSNPYPYYAK